MAQMTLNCNGTILRCEERSLTITAAMDAVSDVLDSRVRRLKGRLYKDEQTKKSGRSSSIRDPEAPADAQEEEEDSYEAGAHGVLWVKGFLMKTLPVDEAIHQMELLCHDFFFFYNIVTSEYSTLYRRLNGGYGLLEPELI